MTGVSHQGDYTIRPFSSVDEFRACVALQEETWGHGFSERVPTAILKVSQILGGVSAGAYDPSGGLVGFVFGMTGLRGGQLVHWSDMLAVRKEARDGGLGRMLKAYQREQVLALGVERMHWTFDPLQSRNAYLNFSKLGIVVHEYVQDMYGQTDSPLHLGIGTDRFIALWQLKSERVEARLARVDAMVTAEDSGDTPFALGVRTDSGEPRPGEANLSLTADRLRVAIPTDIVTIMNHSMELAMEWRMATRPVFAHYLRDGYEVRELVRGDRSSDYLLAKIAQ